MYRAFIAAALATIVLAACSSSSSSTEPAASSSDADGSAITIQLTEFAFEMPDTIPAGVQTLHIENIGGMPHFIDFQGVKGDKTDDDIQALLDDPNAQNGPPPPWITPADMPDIGLYSSQASSDITMNLPPGRYVALCFMPDAQGVPHAVDGMHKVFEVTGEPSDEALPAPDITATWNGTDVEGVPETVPSGTHTIGFANAGTKPTQISLAQLLEDAPADQLQSDVNAWFRSLYAGDPPVTFLGGITGIQPGGDVVAVTTIDLADGEYVLAGPGKAPPASFTVGAGGIPSASAAASTNCTPGGTDLTLTAQDAAFSTGCLAAPADTAFTIAFDNEDANVPHNVAIYPDDDGSAKALFTGDIVTGVADATYDVPALDAGTYRFQCDVHPTTMTGTFVVG